MVEFTREIRDPRPRSVAIARDLLPNIVCLCLHLTTSLIFDMIARSHVFSVTVRICDREIT